MTYEQALGFFKTPQGIGDALDVTRSRDFQCKVAGGFYYSMQCVLEKESGGELLANRSDDPVIEKIPT